jgi:hypothetical protein
VDLREAKRADEWIMLVLVGLMRVMSDLETAQHGAFSRLPCGALTERPRVRGGRKKKHTRRRRQREKRTQHRVHIVESREQRAESRKQRAESREQRAESREHRVQSREHRV